MVASLDLSRPRDLPGKETEMRGVRDSGVVPVGGEVPIDLERTPNAARRLELDRSANADDYLVMAKKTPLKRRLKKTPPPLPTCRAMLLCEKVIKDIYSGTITIVGILTRFDIREFPSSTPMFYVFAQLASGLGDYAVNIEIQDDQERSIVGQSDAFPMDFACKTDVRDIIVPIPPLPLRHAGSYSVVILTNGNEVGYQTFDTPGEANASDTDSAKS